MLEVERSDTISSLMRQLEDRLGVPPITVLIVYNGSPVRKESTLSLHYNFASSYYAFKVETLKTLGIDVERADDDAADKMEIFVRDCFIPCRKGRRVRTIVLEVEATDTVGSVMAQVQGKLGYPAALQLLFC
ncbi:polyubiquitin-like [Setaria italica]|uniref:polyubiquitin-like n=1 Tax=Setaria italica TaxID=4555 RepID=UPI0003513884|nr:polyubiquitin-like [Setaria italica]